MAASIPWEILKSSKRPLRVLDPMAGSGTSLIVARGSGHAAWGFDSDPLAVLVSQVGTVDLSASRVKACAHSVLQAAKQAKISGSDAYPKGADEETRRFVRYWFDLRARKQLAALAKTIREVRDVGTRKVLWCALSRMIIAKDAGVSLARDVSHSRPHKWYTRSPVEPFETFEAAVTRVVAASLFDGTRPTQRVHVRKGDARRLPIKSESIDVVVTSPPYLNAIDYMRGHKLSLVWMGHSIAALRRIRSANIGAESGDLDPEDSGLFQVVRSMGRVLDLPLRFQRMIVRYVLDMTAVIAEIGRVLTPKGQALIVIGDCALRGTYVRNSTAIRLLAEHQGLILTSERRRKIPDSRRYLPPPGRKSGDQLAKRLRDEVILNFRKSGRDDPNLRCYRLA
jgi:hypothetical protein